MSIAKKLIDMYKEVRRCGSSYIVGEKATWDLSRARGVLFAKDIGLEVKWGQDSWEPGDQGDYIKDSDFQKGLASGRFEVLHAWVDDDRGRILSSLSGIIVDYAQADWREYLRGYEYELLDEAQAVLKKGDY